MLGVYVVVARRTFVKVQAVMENVKKEFEAMPANEKERAAFNTFAVNNSAITSMMPLHCGVKRYQTSAVPADPPARGSLLSAWATTTA